MEVPVIPDEASSSFEQFVMEDIDTTSQINAEDVAVNKSVEFPDWQKCPDCYCNYKPCEKTDLWTVAMKMEYESLCDNCHLQKWRKLKQDIKETADKHGFVIVNDEKESIEIGQEVLPQITKKSEDNVSTKAEEGHAVTKNIVEKWYCVRCIGLGLVVPTPNRSSVENLEEKKEVTPEVDDDVIKAIYETERRCVCWEKKDAAVEPIEIGQEVLPEITKKSEDNVSTKAEEGLAVTKDSPEKWYCVRCSGLGVVVPTPNRSLVENLEEKREVTPEVDDDVIKSIYETERRCVCWEKKDAAVKK